MRLYVVSLLKIDYLLSFIMKKWAKIKRLFCLKNKKTTFEYKNRVWKQ